MSDLAQLSGVGAANADLLRKYLDWQTARNRKPSSLYEMASKLGQFVRWCGDVPLGDVPVEHMERWVNRPRRSHPMRADGEVVGSPATRAKDVALLKSMYAFLHGRELVASNPTVVLIAPTVDNESPKPIDVETWTSVWSDSRLPLEAQCVLGLGFFAGLRRHEIVRLAPWQWSDGKLRGVARKGGGRDNTIPVADMLNVFATRMPELLGRRGADSVLVPLNKLASQRQGAARLLPWTERDGEPCRHSRRKFQLGPDEIDPERVNVYVERWLKTVGRPAAFTPHQLRHSTATYLLQCGVPLHLTAKLMNHRNIQTTMRYIKAGGDELAQWASSQWAKPFDPSELGSRF